jgi:hypothetical protein
MACCDSIHQLIRNRSSRVFAKEIALALDVAERQPKGAIYVTPICLDHCKMPKRLAHLHWSSIPRDMVAEIYVTLQSSLLTRASELGFLGNEQIQNIPTMPAMAKGWRPSLIREDDIWCGAKTQTERHISVRPG